MFSVVQYVGMSVDVFCDYNVVFFNNCIDLDYVYILMLFGDRVDQFVEVMQYIGVLVVVGDVDFVFIIVKIIYIVCLGESFWIIVKCCGVVVKQFK